MKSYITFLVAAIVTIAVTVGLHGGLLPNGSPILVESVDAQALDLPEFDLGDAISAAVAALALLQGLPRLLSLLGQLLVYFNVLDPGPISSYIKLIMSAVFIGLFVASIFGAVPIILKLDSTLNGYVALLAQLLILMGIPVANEVHRNTFQLPRSRFGI